MFLHLGSDIVIPLRDIISITDLKASRTHINEDFIKSKQKKNIVVDISEGHAKSFVVANDKVYLSPISSLTLKKRAGNFFEIDE